MDQEMKKPTKALNSSLCLTSPLIIDPTEAFLSKQGCPASGCPTSAPIRPCYGLVDVGPAGGIQTVIK